VDPQAEAQYEPVWIIENMSRWECQATEGGPGLRRAEPFAVIAGAAGCIVSGAGGDKTRIASSGYNLSPRSIG